MIWPEAKCTVCNGPTKVAFSSGRPFKYCSDLCRSRARSFIGASTPEVTCGRCGHIFTTRLPGKKYCNAECRREAQNAQRRSDSSGGTHERRCRRYKREYRRIDPMRIFERDYWLCQICLAPVDKDVAFPDQLAATLDHIVPLSRGGDHIESNLQTAHWACNSMKSSKLESELCPAGAHHYRQST
jgi:5-methylcytosine-specific restriction endonuclease McrA